MIFDTQMFLLSSYLTEKSLFVIYKNTYFGFQGVYHINTICLNYEN